MIVGSDVIEPLIAGSDIIEPMIVGGFRRYHMPDVIDIISDVILVIWSAPHPRCVAAGTCQCSC